MVTLTFSKELLEKLCASVLIAVRCCIYDMNLRTYTTNARMNSNAYPHFFFTPQLRNNVRIETVKTLHCFRLYVF
jgi:hypothetical protein